MRSSLVFRSVPVRHLLLILGIVAHGSVSFAGCPLCPPPRLTWAESKRDSDAMLLGTLIRVEKETPTSPGAAVFAVRDVHSGKQLVPRGHLRIAGFVFGKPGDLFVLKAAWNAPAAEEEIGRADTANPGSVTQVSVSRPRSLIWEVSERLTQQTWEYIESVPDADVEPETRLEFCLRHLESDDASIAADAWAEFAKAEYTDIRKLRKQFDPADLRKWIEASDAAPERVNLYALMLGMCGDEQDQKFFKERIAKEGISFGLEGLLGGLIVLSGNEGLEFMQETLLSDPEADALRLWAAVQALQFAWNHEREAIGNEPLRAALRAAVVQESTREMVLTLLTQWQDWALIDQIPALYESCREDSRCVEAIAAFVLLYQKAHQEHDVKGRRTAETVLRQLRQKHPRVVSRLRRQLRIPDEI